VQPERGRPLAFVDLPGYGYARVPREMREQWRPLVESYLGRREGLRAVVVIVDPRRGAEREEVELVAWLRQMDLAVIAVVTKIDKLAKARRKPAGLAVQRALGLARPPLPFSAHTGEGVDELWREILGRV
jgi:GTP-binding protein